MLTESLKRNTEPDFPVSFSLTSDPQKLWDDSPRFVILDQLA
jgi:hypothetical protein